MSIRRCDIPQLVPSRAGCAVNRLMEERLRQRVIAGANQVIRRGDMSVYIKAREIRRVRRCLYENQSEFGARFDVCRRTVIRWEQDGHIFLSYDSCQYDPSRGGKSSAKLWADAVAGRKNLSKPSTTAIVARKPASARRRKSARKKAVAVKRRRGRVARRRSLARKAAMRRKKK